MKSDNNKGWGGCGETAASSSAGGASDGAATLGDSLAVSKMLTD